MARALRKVQQQELGAVEVKKEHEVDYEATFQEIKDLLCEGSEAGGEGSAVAESSSDGFEELDVASLPSIQAIFDMQDLKRGRATKKEEE